MEKLLIGKTADGVDVYVKVDNPHMLAHSDVKNELIAEAIQKITYGNTTFIIRCVKDCGSPKLKIYDSSNMEINFSEKSIFNDGFTKIQKIIILLTFFEDKSQK